MAIDRKIIREYCPNIKLLRRFLQKLRVVQYEKEFVDIDLIEKCVNNPELKKSVLYDYTQKWPDKAEELKKTALESGISSENLDDVLFSNFAYGLRVDEYIVFGLLDKSEEEKSQFISDKKFSELTVRMNDLFDGEVYWDKTKTFIKMKRYYNRECLPVSKKTPICSIENFIKRYPIFIKKIGVSSFGKGVEKIDLSREKLGGVPVSDRVMQWVSGGENILLEEPITQSRQMSLFNPSSVNTVRIISFITRHGIITPYAFLKNGRDGSFVDNGGSGGIFIGIDTISGNLITDGIDEKRRKYKEHPNTGIVYKGERLPDWDNAISLCKEMAMEIPSVKMVGWDIAHTDNGWILVEANERSQIIGPQLTFDMGLKNEIYKIMKDMDLIVPYSKKGRGGNSAFL